LKLKKGVTRIDYICVTIVLDKNWRGRANGVEEMKDIPVDIERLRPLASG
jgi:hypothetical protein